MSTVDLTTRNDLAIPLARRAIDLARDVLVPSDDGAEHLLRLSMGRREVLQDALTELDRQPPSAAVVCARRLLVSAIERWSDRPIVVAPSHDAGHVGTGP